MLMISLLLNIPDEIWSLALLVASSPIEVIIHETLAIESSTLRIDLCQIGKICCQDEIPLLILRYKVRLINTDQRVAPVSEKTDLLFEAYRLAIKAKQIGSTDMGGITI